MCSKRLPGLKFVNNKIVNRLRTIHIVHLMCKTYQNKKLTLMELEDKI